MARIPRFCLFELVEVIDQPSSNKENLSDADVETSQRAFINARNDIGERRFAMKLADTNAQKGTANSAVPRFYGPPTWSSQIVSANAEGLKRLQVRPLDHVHGRNGKRAAECVPLPPAKRKIDSETATSPEAFASDVESEIQVLDSVTSDNADRQVLSWDVNPPEFTGVCVNCEKLMKEIDQLKQQLQQFQQPSHDAQSEQFPLANVTEPIPDHVLIGIPRGEVTHYVSILLVTIYGRQQLNVWKMTGAKVTVGTSKKVEMPGIQRQRIIEAVKKMYPELGEGPIRKAISQKLGNCRG